MIGILPGAASPPGVHSKLTRIQLPSLGPAAAARASARRPAAPASHRTMPIRSASVPSAATVSASWKPSGAPSGGGGGTV
eukprot:scaffold178277_cov24-Tisochrysis_lutea.AAC.2